MSKKRYWRGKHSRVSYGRRWYDPKTKMRYCYAYVDGQRRGVVGFKQGNPVWVKKFQRKKLVM